MGLRMGITVLLFVILCAMMVTSDAMYVPKSRGMAAAEALKRTVVTGARQKRYTDYQERASAFCTGLCMYEERKSYSECFDLCNWQMIRPDSRNQAAHSQQIQHSFTDPDYSNDEAVSHQKTDTEQSNEKGQSGSQDKNSNRKGSKGNKQRKGKKPKNKSPKPKEGKTSSKDLAKQKQMLKDLRRKLMQQIEQKEDKLSSKAITLQSEIDALENEIQQNRDSIMDLETRLEGIGAEMNNIEELKANVSILVKDRRKMLLGKVTTPSDQINNFLMPENEFETNTDLSNVLKEFLVQEKTKRMQNGRNDQIQWLSSWRQRPSGPIAGQQGFPLVDKGKILDHASSNLDGLLTSDITKETL